MKVFTTHTERIRIKPTITLMTSSNTRSGLIPYQKSLSQLLEKFEEVTFFHLSREKKKFADALPTLASMTKGFALQIEAKDSPAYCLNIEEEPDGRPWYHDSSISRLGNILQGQQKRRTIRRLSMGFLRSG